MNQEQETKWCDTIQLTITLAEANELLSALDPYENNTIGPDDLYWKISALVKEAK